MKAEISLTEEEVKVIIRNHLRKRFIQVGEIKIDVGVTYKGTWVGSRDETYSVGKFNAIKAEVEI